MNTVNTNDNPHGPLKDDLGLLEQLLWEAVRGHEGETSASFLEEALQLSVAGRRGDDAARKNLHDLLLGLTNREKLVMARGFAQYLNLANIAEQYHRIRRRRFYLRNPGHGLQRGSVKEGFRRLLESGTSCGAPRGSLSTRIRHISVINEHAAHTRGNIGDEVILLGNCDPYGTFCTTYTPNVERVI